MKKLLTLSFLPLAMLLIGADGPQSPPDSIAFPADYRDSYTNYLSLDRVQNPDQVIRLFANDTAMAGPGEDGKLAYGSIIVAEVYKARKDKDGNVMESMLGRRIRDEMVLIAVMQREPGWGEQHPDNLRNENWELAAFKPDGSVAAKDINACRECHAPLDKTHHLFSYEHLIPAH